MRFRVNCHRGNAGPSGLPADGLSDGLVIYPVTIWPVTIFASQHEAEGGHAGAGQHHGAVPAQGGEELLAAERGGGGIKIRVKKSVKVFHGR